MKCIGALPTKLVSKHFCSTFSYVSPLERMASTIAMLTHIEFPIVHEQLHMQIACELLNH